MTESINRGQVPEKKKEKLYTRREALALFGAAAADQIFLKGAVRKKVIEALTSDGAKEFYGKALDAAGEVVGDVVDAAGNKISTAASGDASTAPPVDIQNDRSQVLAEAGILVTEFGFNPPENVPFEEIAWPYAPYNEQYPRKYVKDTWSNVRQWAGHAIRHSNIDYIGAGMTLAEMLRSQGEDETVLLSQMWQESMGNPNAVAEGADDTGLGQIVPSDGKGANYAWTKGRPTKQQLLDPDINVEWMVRILSDGFMRNGGTTKGAISYYAGQGKDGYADMILWLNNHIRGRI